VADSTEGISGWLPLDREELRTVFVPGVVLLTAVALGIPGTIETVSRILGPLPTAVQVQFYLVTLIAGGYLLGLVTSLAARWLHRHAFRVQAFNAALAHFGDELLPYHVLGGPCPDSEGRMVYRFYDELGAYAEELVGPPVIAHPFRPIRDHQGCRIGLDQGGRAHPRGKGPGYQRVAAH
jgi:hypothetical protein